MARPAGDSREKILNAARDLFGEKGVDATSIRAIARQAGVNLGMIHYFFQTKDNLVDAVLERYFKNVGAALESVPADADPRQRLAAAITGIVKYLQNNQQVVRIVIREYSVGSLRLQRIAQQYMGPNFGRLALIVAEGIGRGQFKALDVRFLAMVTLGMMIHPFMASPLLSQFLDLDFTSEDFADTLTTVIHTVLFKGIERRIPRVKS